MNNTRAFKFVPESLKGAKMNKIALKPKEDDLLLLSKKGVHCAFAYIPEAKKTRKLCFEAVADDSDALQFVPDKIYDCRTLPYGG